MNHFRGVKSITKRAKVLHKGDTVLTMDASTPQDYLDSSSSSTTSTSSSTKGHHYFSAPSSRSIKSVSMQFTFSLGKQITPAALLQLLLVMAGIEPNPGPNTNIWLCSVCNHQISRNTISVKCNNCNQWCHMKKCTNLQSHKNWNSFFVASCCNQSNQSPNTNQQTRSDINQNDVTPLKILQFNCRGIQGNIDEI